MNMLSLLESYTHSNTKTPSISRTMEPYKLVTSLQAKCGTTIYTQPYAS